MDAEQKRRIQHGGQRGPRNEPQIEKCRSKMITKNNMRLRTEKKEIGCSNEADPGRLGGLGKGQGEGKPPARRVTDTTQP